jgi:hypothetical protein
MPIPGKTKGPGSPDLVFYNQMIGSVEFQKLNTTPAPTNMLCCFFCGFRFVLGVSV